MEPKSGSEILEAAFADADGIMAARAAWNALDEALVVGPQTTLDSYPTPRDAIHALIQWETAVALDPRVSEPARRLQAKATAALAGLMAWASLARLRDPGLAASIDNDPCWERARAVLSDATE